MKPIILLIFTLLTIILNAQKLTTSQALDFAEKLYQNEILSQKGRNILVEKIKTNTFQSEGITMLKNGKFGRSYERDLQTSYILKFCTQVFGSEFDYRLGYDKAGQKIQEEVFKGYDSNKISEEEHQTLSDELHKRKLLLEGPAIENLIPEEDSLPKGFSFTISLMSFPTGENLVGSAHKTKSVSGKTRTSLLNALLKTGLINQRIYDETLPKIKSNSLFLEVYVMDFITERFVYYEDFDENLKNQLVFLENLKTNNILSETQHKNLIKSYKPYELKRHFDFISYCNNALVFELSQYPRNPEDYYRLIFNDIKKILPDFDFTNLSIKVFENPRFKSDLIELKASISFDVKGRTYKNTFWHDFMKKNPTEKDKKEKLPPISIDFHKGINKWLADINSEKRLYYANKSDIDKQGNLEGAYSKETFGLILLHEKQYKTWKTSESSYFLFSQSHDNTFNTEGVKTIIQEYEKIGLFNHLSKAEIDSAKMKVTESEISNYQDILLCFPKNIIYFDWESGNLENPYEELTLNFAAASRGEFTPHTIKDNFLKDEQKEKTRYGFTLQGKKYETTLKMNNDWLDPQFIELIKQAIKDQNIDGNIYYCLDNGQAVGYIFLNKRQYEYLKKYHPSFLDSKD